MSKGVEDYRDKRYEEELNEKFLWLQVIHIVEDILPTDNPATGLKTIQVLFDKFEIKEKK